MRRPPQLYGMNWTGGRRQRHSTRSDPLKHRQQQHFARVKGRLLGVKKRAPVKGPRLDRIRGLHTGLPTDSNVTSFSHQESSCNEGNPSDSPTKGPFPPITNTILQNGGNPSHHREPTRQCPVSLTKCERVPSDDLYNATPPPISKMAKRDREPSMSASGEESDTDQEELLSDKRRKILQREDWVSVGFQRPPRLSFTNPKYSDAVGKRRQVSDGHRAQYIRSPRPRNTSSQVIRNLRQVAHNPGENAGELPRRPDVRIPIGEKVFPPGISSGSAPSQTRSILSLPPPSNSSEVMLLGSEEIQPRTDGSSNYHGHMRIEGRARGRDARNKPSWYAQMLLSEGRAEHINHGSSRNSDRELREDAEVSNKFSNKSNFTSWVQTRRRPFSSHEDDSRPSNSPQPRSSLEVDSGNTPRRPEPIFSSSSAPLHHPIPKNCKVSPLLETTSSEVAESIIAEVGQVKSLIPSSQIADNNVWETWMTSFQNCDGFDRFGDTLPANNRSVLISPGVSEASEYQSQHADMYSDEEESWDSASCDPAHLEEILECQSSLRLELASQEQIQEMERQMNVSTSLPSSDRDWFEPNVIHQDTDENWPGFSPKAADLPTSPAPNPSMGVARVSSTKGDEPDEMWKRFVFGSDGEEFDIFHHQASKNISEEERPGTISPRTISPATVNQGISVAASGCSLHSWCSDSALATGCATTSPTHEPLEEELESDRWPRDYF